MADHMGAYNIERLLSNLTSLIVKYPYIANADDETSESALIKWLVSSYKKKYNENLDRNEAHGIIKKLSDEGIFIRKNYSGRILLKPTQNYFRIKKGEEPIIKQKDEKQNYNQEFDILESNIEKLPNSDLSNNSELSINHITTSYDEYLKGIIQNYQGQDKELVKHFPYFYKLACNILNDRYTDWHSKILISSALGYFILEMDVIPDSDEFGYLDDLFIISYVLREIKKHTSDHLILNNWDYQEDILELIETVYADSYYIVQDYACEILHKVGLWKFKELQLEDYSGKYPQKIAKLAEEKRETLGLLAYTVNLIYNTKMKARDLKELKSFLMKYGDYDEITRLIELSKKDREYFTQEMIEEKEFETQLEEELKAARIRALIEDRD